VEACTAPAAERLTIAEQTARSHAHAALRKGAVQLDLTGGKKENEAKTTCSRSSITAAVQRQIKENLVSPFPLFAPVNLLTGFIGRNNSANRLAGSIGFSGVPACQGALESSNLRNGRRWF
jgi:hypothetical protein